MKKKFISIEKKLIKSYLLIVIIPLIIFSFIFFIVSIGAYLRVSINSNIVSVEQTASKLELVVNDIITVSNIYTFDDKLQNIIYEDIDTDLWAYDYIRNREYIDSVFDKNTYAFGWLEYRATIYGINDTYYDSHLTDNKENLTFDKMKSNKWFNDAIENNGRITWVNNAFEDLPEFYDDDYYISAVKSLNSRYNGQVMGILVLSIKKESFESLYEDSIEENNSMIIENDNIIMSSYPNDVTGNIANINNLRFYKTKDNGYDIDFYNDELNLIIYNKINNSDLSIYKFIPITNLISPYIILARITIIIIFVIIILIILYGRKKAKSFSDPITNLYKDMKLLEEGNFNVESKVMTTDEIGILANRFNKMVIEINSLMEHIIIEKDLKRKAELESLQSQINPHFLYNTLATIRFMLGSKSDEVIDETIISLVGLLKNTISRTDEFIPIEDEIDNLKKYMQIQNVRYGNRIILNCNISQDFMQILIPKLILQPIVENAIFHGLSSMESMGNINISAECVENNLIINITDNGIGITKDILTEINNGNRESFNGIGVKNVDERIKLYFGLEYGLTLYSEENKGTTAKLVLPIEKGE